MNAHSKVAEQNSLKLEEPPSLAALPDGNEVTVPEATRIPALSAAAAGPEPDDDEPPTTFEIEPQCRIVIRGLMSGGVAIEQVGSHGFVENDDGGIVEVSGINVVAFCRRVLFAAGYKDALIATTGGGGGGFEDILDGDVPSRFSRVREPY